MYFPAVASAAAVDTTHSNILAFPYNYSLPTVYTLAAVIVPDLIVVDPLQAEQVVAEFYQYLALAHAKKTGTALVLVISAILVAVFVDLQTVLAVHYIHPHITSVLATTVID